MARELRCDICKRPTTELVGKLFYTPLTRGQGANSFHARYSHHADVGSCCAERLLAGFDFQERKSAKEYHASRRKQRIKSK